MVRSIEAESVDGCASDNLLTGSGLGLITGKKRLMGFTAEGRFCAVWVKREALAGPTGGGRSPRGRPSLLEKLPDGLKICMILSSWYEFRRFSFFLRSRLQKNPQKELPGTQIRRNINEGYSGTVLLKTRNGRGRVATCHHTHQKGGIRQSILA